VVKIIASLQKGRNLTQGVQMFGSFVGFLIALGLAYYVYVLEVEDASSRRQKKS
jgi:hypothetical protein